MPHLIPEHSLTPAVVSQYRIATAEGPNFANLTLSKNLTDVTQDKTAQERDNVVDYCKKLLFISDISASKAQLPNHWNQPLRFMGLMLK